MIGIIHNMTNKVRILVDRETLSEFGIWKGMKRRCFSKHGNNGEKHYRLRGITVCERWVGPEGFQNFLDDMGLRPTPKHSIDRIDGNGNYEPSNCRWASTTEQAWNRNNNLQINYQGRIMRLKEAYELAGSTVSQKMVRLRIQRGWDHARALETGYLNSGYASGKKRQPRSY